MKPEGFDFHSNFIEIAGYKMHYLDEGSGGVLIMLHGNPTWGYLYRNFIPELSKEYRCIVPDFLGFGYSDKPAGEDYSLQAQSQRLAQFIEKMELNEITLVVHDIGGIVGLAWAAEHKHLVKGLVILNNSGSVPEVWGKSPYLPPWSYIVLWPLRIPVIGEVMVENLNILHRLVMPLAFSRRDVFTKKIRRGFGYPYRCKADRKAQLSTIRQIPILKSDPIYRMLLKTGQMLNGWQVPAQIIWGLKDPSSPPRIIKVLERLLPNHRPSVVLPQAGHFLTEEQPEVVLDKIKEFLKTIDNSPNLNT
ncbi:alpha/beta fold hydrolase [Desulfofalx alkaliphila]|uniref:alpha/beta fold hydrolase n=1 Tax=Desulfofalx alkaliphila TaxID=105483 RepID=UPI0004E0C6D3|nr:alpha/beta fold hydrolase [Desulfofalx alkaliphila]